jgi:methyl-accepting chemotaxis protein PixJ
MSESTNIDEVLSLTTIPKRESKLTNFVRNNLIATIGTTIVGSLVVTGFSSWQIWSIYQGFRSTVTKQFTLQKNTEQIKYLDEVLTMSARMAASTGNLQWQQRYDRHVPELDRVLKDTLENVPQNIQNEAKKTDVANAKLIDLESQAFALVRQQKSAEALQILLGLEYNSQKEIYTQGNDRVLEQIDRYIDTQLKQYQQQLFSSILFAGIMLPVLLAGWLLVLSATREYIRERKYAQNNFEKSQIALEKINENLQKEGRIRVARELQIANENEQLQADVEKLLELVWEVEKGDFTIQADVNNRTTGLISDTLNRSIETLGGLLLQVSKTNDLGAENSNYQQNLANAVVSDSQRQVASVKEIQRLTKQVRSAAQNATKKLVETNSSLVILQKNVRDGRINIGAIDGEIDILRQGNDRIVQQMKTLGEFVGLADRFVRDQTEIATETQILAMNAALVAARAAEQRDPQQFSKVAREFENIAVQVTELAQQTNQGLSDLEQQSNQIYKIVSAVDGEVQNLGSLVERVEGVVKQTEAVFTSVENVTEEAVAAGNNVAADSAIIVKAAEEAETAVSSIATLAGKIAEQSKDARHIADRTHELSLALSSQIRVFKLPEDPLLKETVLVS